MRMLVFATASLAGKIGATFDHFLFLYCPVPVTGNDSEPVAQLVVTEIAPLIVPVLVGVK
jgi:hypothetical protein